MLAVLLLAPRLAVAQQPLTGPVIALTKQDFVQTVDAKTMGRYFPERALRMNRSGRVTLICRVADGGLLTNCSVAAEDQPDFGFGAAAINVTPFFRVNSQSVDGRPLWGATVKLNIGFPIPQ